MSLPKKVNFANLDTLRFVAFFGVFISHLSIKTDFNFINFLSHQGSLGVDLFFVISGFLITYLLIVEKENFNNINLWSFFVRRGFRIWPLYFGFIGVTFLITFISSESPPPEEAIQHFGLYPLMLGNFDRIFFNYETIDLFAGSGVLWSISIEEQFYLFIPFLVFIVPNGKKLIWFLIGIHIITILFKFFVILNYEDYDLAYRTLGFHPLSKFDLISMGCLVGYFAVYHFELIKKTANKLKPIHLYGLLMIFIGINYLVFVLPNVYVQSIIAQEIFGITFVLFVIFIAFNKKNESPRNKTLNYLGKISYGLYIYHVPAILIINKLFGNTKGFLPSFLFSLLLTIIMAHFSYKYFESYFIRKKHKFSRIKTR